MNIENNTTNATHTVMVSIRCTAYNHEKFIRDALEGFVMQKTNFRFEAIVHDDASTDGTAAIIHEYAEKYPDIIKPIYETENQYSKGDGSIRRIMDEAMSPEAKYIAYCEGDDYWTDPLKLQKQVDFMESHAEYSMCFHRVIEHFHDNSLPDRIFALTESRDYTGLEIYDNWIIQTASILIRKEILTTNIYKKAIQNRKFAYGDILIFLSCASCGKVHGMVDVMSVYRRHQGGITYDLSYRNIKRNLKHNTAIYKVFGTKYRKITLRKNSYESYTLMRMYIRDRKLTFMKYLFISFLYSPSLFIKRTLRFTRKL